MPFLSSIPTLGLLLLAPPASLPRAGVASVPHPGPPIYLQYEVSAGQVQLMVSGEQKVLNPLLGRTGHLDLPLSEADEADLASKASELFARVAVLEIDGRRVVPSLESLRAYESFGPGNPEPALEFNLEYACEGMPETIHVTWQLFEQEQEAGVPTLFRQGEGFFEFTAIHPDEPEFTWHGRNMTLARPAEAPRTVPAAPPVLRRYPLFSLLALVLALVASPLLWRRGGARGLVLLWALLGGGAFALREVGTPPPWGGRVLMPSEDQALAMFSVLHANIYRAMGARDEEQIYSVLASAVDADQLDELYGEVYESMVLREEGGAFCTIDEVLPTAHTISMEEQVDSEDDLLFEVDWSWRVRGSVVHYGHRHERVNLYRALYSVAYDGESWKIAAWDVLEHRRSDDGGGLLTLVGEQSAGVDGEGASAEGDDE